VNRLSPSSLFRLQVVIPLLLAMSIFSMVTTPTYAASNHANRPANPPVIPFKGKFFTLAQMSQKPPTDAQCRTHTGFPCYSPHEISQAYGVTPLLNSGFTGKGQSIVIIDSFGSPTIQHDLHVFDQGYGLPDPSSFQILAPLGTVPFNPQKNPNQVGWAFETSLDVEWAHALAPDAKIVLLTSPVDETEGVQGLPQFLFLEQYALDHHLGKIISQSWGATEDTLFTPDGSRVIQSFEQLYQRARDEHVTVLASSGDTGSTGSMINNKLYPFPVVGFPASSPLVTAVGGTSLFASTSGNYQKEIVWDNNLGASGGGVSKIFQEPDYQQNNLPTSDQNLLNGHRGMPDIAYNADPHTGILIYASFISPAGYYLIGGTSAGSPQWAGIIADANQLAGHPLGFLNPAIYSIGNSSDYSGSFHDITFGSNAFAGVQGFNATPGWDLSTGWGSPNVATFVTQLIKRI
jgi:subtilase family serine protease